MFYYINRTSHEVHCFEGCARQPYGENRCTLGVFGNFDEAISEAKRRGYNRANSCGYCDR